MEGNHLMDAFRVAERKTIQEIIVRNTDTCNIILSRQPAFISKCTSDRHQHREYTDANNSSYTGDQ